MNQAQRNKIQGHIDQYFQLDITDLLSRSFPDVDENQVVIGEYTTNEFHSLLNKVFSQFREELKDVYFKSLPLQYQFQNEFGGGDLNSDLGTVIAYIESNRFPNALAHLLRLIHYQAINGFWEKSKRKYFRTSEDSVNSEKERIELVSKQLAVSVEKLKGLLEEIEAGKEELEIFTNAKQKELSEIESLLTSARTHNTEIAQLHSSMTVTAEKVTSILNNSDEKKVEADELLVEFNVLLKQAKQSLAEQDNVTTIQNKEYIALKSSFEKKLAVVEGKTEYFTERNNYLDDLIGREVGASLFETFKHRKEELSSGIGFWKWSVPISAVATILWIFFLFGSGDLNDLEWQVIFVNSLKALPAIGILLFAVSQYTKERNFQEEYAFKSAVALTINAYADQLLDGTNKDQLIMKSVKGMYTTPIHHKTTNTSNETSLSETAKELMDVAKSIISSKAE